MTDLLMRALGLIYLVLLSTSCIYACIKPWCADFELCGIAQLIHFITFSVYIIMFPICSPILLVACLLSMNGTSKKALSFSCLYRIASLLVEDCDALALSLWQVTFWQFLLFPSHFSYPALPPRSLDTFSSQKVFKQWPNSSQELWSSELLVSIV